MSIVYYINLTDTQGLSVLSGSDGEWTMMKKDLIHRLKLDHEGKGDGCKLWQIAKLFFYAIVWQMGNLIDIW